MMTPEPGEGTALKVFISHSTSDRWIARRISEDLESFGVETFLDEKDIETGESIDASIQKHLKDCDELLMLLSPAAIASPWVLVEIGGAKALDKRLIPITVHVPTNDLPKPISGGLARDLNDIGRYYEEVKRRLAGEKTEPSVIVSPRLRRVSATKRFQVGQLVKIMDSPPSLSDPAVLGQPGWNEEMGAYLGRVTKVVETDDQRGFVTLEVDPGWFWAPQWIEPFYGSGYGRGLDQLLNP